MSAQPATAARVRLDPLTHEALLLRHQQAIDVLWYPDVHGVPAIGLEQRVSLLAAVVWPSPKLLEWSMEQARAKLERRLSA